MLKTCLSKLPDRTALAWLLLPVVVSVALLAFDRFVVEHRFFALWAEDLLARGLSDNDIRFAAQVWLSSGCVVLLVLLPLIYLWLFPMRDKTHPWGLGARHIGEHWRLYAAAMAVMLPILWIAAGTDGFRNFYPLYDPDTWQRWLAFEAIYLTQFFCVEFFFRGPLLFRLAQRFEFAAIGMMVVPYALLHIYKPFPEALGAIAAGFVLGYLALRTRSIWPGVMLHCGVALSMDCFALIRSGRMATLLG